MDQELIPYRYPSVVVGRMLFKKILRLHRFKLVQVEMWHDRSSCKHASIDRVGFLASDSMLSALYAIANPSVCPSHGWISRKRLNLGLCNFHHTVAPSLSCVRYKFHREIPTGSPGAGASNKGGLVKRANIVGVVMLSPGGSIC